MTFDHAFSVHFVYPFEILRHSVKSLPHACSLRHLLTRCSFSIRLRFRPYFDSIVSSCPFLDHLPFLHGNPMSYLLYHLSSRVMYYEQMANRSINQRQQNERPANAEASTTFSGIWSLSHGAIDEHQSPPHSDSERCGRVGVDRGC